jgi:tetratricopeptide (TPR) repeat protein
VFGCAYRKLADSPLRQRLLAVVPVAAILVFTAMTLQQIGVWRNPVSFWTRVVKVDPGVIAYKERGLVYAVSGDYSAAVADYSEAIRIATGIFRETIYNLYAYRGEAQFKAGRFGEAVQDLTAAIELYPHPAYFHTRGIALKALGRTRESAQDFERAGPTPGTINWFNK